MARISISLLFIFLTGVGYTVSFAQDKYEFVVAKDGSGDFTSIQSAIDACKAFPPQRIKILIKKGVYEEKLIIPACNTYLSLIGENPDSTIITYGDHFKKIDRGRNSTFYTATLQVLANDFHAENLTIINSAGPVGQALALDIQGDRCTVEKCRLLGNQDTVYLAGEGSRIYFRKCYIEGTTDFIFGEATAVFEKCIITAKANSFLTAASTPKDQAYGFVFIKCQIHALPGVNKVYLGRPWRSYAKTVFLHCEMGDFILPSGWDNWSSGENEKTAYYAEYQNTGPGSDRKGRVGWSKKLTDQEAALYTTEKIFGKAATEMMNR